MVRASMQRPKAEQSPSWCTRTASSLFPRGNTRSTIAKTNFLELEIALWVRVGRTKDFKLMPKMRVEVGSG